MKVRVQYTFELSDEDRRAWARYTGGVVDRATIKATLEMIGTEGVAEQISEGWVRIGADRRMGREA